MRLEFGSRGGGTEKKKEEEEEENIMLGRGGKTEGKVLL